MTAVATLTRMSVPTGVEMLAAEQGGVARKVRMPYVRTASDMTALLKADLADGEMMRTLGRTAARDRGEGTFQWVAGDLTTVDGGTAFGANEGGAGRWLRVWDGVIAYPEWWGVSAGDWYPAITAALASPAPITQLTFSDYNTTQTVKVPAHKILRGSGWEFSIPGSATRLLLQNATGTILQLGDDAFSGSPSTMASGPRVMDLYVARNTAPNVSYDTCVGVLIQYCVHARVERVRSNESLYAFRYRGTVDLYMHDCRAKRDTPGVGGTDHHVGFYQDGGASIGTAGSNASARLLHCASEMGTVIANSTGFLADGSFTDGWWNDCETTGLAIGMQVSGRGSSANATENTDMTIINPVNDGCTFCCLKLDAIGPSGAVNVINPYGGPASGATYNLWLNNCLGAVTVQAGTLVNQISTSVIGIAATGSQGWRVEGTIVTETTATVCYLSGCANFVLAATLVNDRTTGGNAVQANGTMAAGKIAVLVKGKASAFSLGIQVVGTGDNRCEYSMTGIDSACIAGGSGNKLVRNGTQITAAGATGTNVASGVMA